jgi:PAS domain S-box-containing protein
VKLRTKIITAFGVLGAFTLLVALFGFHEVQRLGAALYEVGVVRLPSIRGLVMISGAMEELGRPPLVPEAGMDAAGLARERARRARAWERFEAGWKLYEPLPQTEPEAALWRAFVPEARAWRDECTAILAALEAAEAARDPAALAAARARLLALAEQRGARTSGLLGHLIALNYRVAEEAKQSTITSYEDMARVRRLMVAAALVSVVAAVAFGVIVGRRLSRPVTQMAEALDRVAAGDRRVRVEPRSHDEIGRMVGALNRMVDALRANEARLRLLGDNLPDSMVYQLAREPDGAKRFLYVSAGVERLHGLAPEAVLRDAAALRDRILPEDRPLVEAAERESELAMTTFDVTIRMRDAQGALRWRRLASQPRRESDGRIVWDGIETDLTAQKQAELEREHLARAIDRHFDGAYWMDATDRFRYVNDAACREVGYTRAELIGQPVSLVAPGATPARMERVWRELRARGVYRGEGVHRRKDGSTFPVEIVASYVRLGDEEFNWGFARDISARKRAEAELQQQLAELKRWQAVTLDREGRVSELKAEINALCARLGEPPRFGAGPAPALGHRG